MSKGPGIRLTRFSERWNFCLQNATSSTPISDTGPTSKDPPPSGSGEVSPMAAFLISSISADRPRKDPEEFIDSQTSSPILRRERTLTPIDDEPEAKSGSLFILRDPE
ncbi:hypothetical protein HID58_028911 [Brassica napus]|uniref:Uncharacterized protein n=1 Tax=Brassica napus TaxID=3708 RepID=A0ABQ8CBJ5_BRANA|nr:hypothetical protein HID58_028911 [Brassica napus]